MTRATKLTTRLTINPTSVRYPERKKMNQVKRDLHFVAPQVRQTVVKKILMYWMFCLVFSTLPLILGATIAQPNRFFTEHMVELGLRYWPMYVMLIGLLPFALRDALRLSNRTFGPLDRLKTELATFKATGKYNPVRSRQDDLLHELIQDVDEALASKSAATANVQVTRDELAETAV